MARNGMARWFFMLVSLFLVVGQVPLAVAARPVEVIPATGPEVLAAVRAAGGSVTLVNVWATWCKPCLEEMPDLLRLGKEYRDRGMKVILVSGDFDTQMPAVIEFLERQGVDFPSYIKKGDDMEFIEAMNANWSGALPASFLFDAAGRQKDFWEGKISYLELEKKVRKILSDPKTFQKKEKAS
ncbi:MAG: TlpA disulfide reductase family protein [Acidobacteriota bacterium]